MSTELTTLDQEAIAEFLKASGQTKDQANKFVNLPRVSTNKNGEDDDGNSIPAGTFVVSQDGKAVYGKSARFRVIINAYQYSVYDEKKEEYTNQSVIFKSWNDEAIDEKGGTSCGKIRGKKLADVTDQVILDEQKQIKCYRWVYGMLSMEGVDAKGNAVVVEELPCYLRLSGSNFMDIQKNGLDVIDKKKRVWSTVPLKLSLKREKQGKNVWYVIVVDPDFNDVVQVSVRDIEASKLFQEHIDTTNNAIYDKYKNARKQHVDTAEDMEVINSLDDDLRDDDPIELT